MNDDPLLADVPQDPELDYQLRRRREMFPPHSDNRVQQNIEATMRQFDTGATRHTDEDKLDYEGFLSPVVLRRFAEYMHKNRVQADGELRASDNWQKGIPPEAYMKSLLRHVMEVWQWHRANNNGADVDQPFLEEALCGVLFNAMGYLHELVKQ